MNRINFENGKTKANAETMDKFQDNIEAAIDENAANIITNATNITELQNGKIDNFKSTSVTDFNDLTETGFYYCSLSSTGALNNPVAGNGYLIVHRLNDNYIYQMFTTVSGGYSYARICYSGAWKDWIAFMYKTGGTLTGTLNAQNILPTATNTYSLGSSSMYWNYMYLNFLRLTNNNIIHDSDGYMLLRTNQSVIVRNYTDINTHMPIVASAFNQSSSRRYKENITDMSDEEASKLDNVNIVTFDYINPKNGVNQAGVIAEDIYEILPNVVTMAEVDGEKVPDSVDYSKFVPYLIKKVQMLEKRVSEFEGKGEV